MPIDPKLLEREREIEPLSGSISPTPIDQNLLERQREIEVPSTSISPTHPPKKTTARRMRRASSFLFRKGGVQGRENLLLFSKEKGFPSPGVSPPAHDIFRP